MVVVEGEGLDEDWNARGSAWGWPADRDAHRIAHVVQAVEEADQVVGAAVALGIGDLERRPARHAGLLGPFPCRRDRGRVEVETLYVGVRAGGASTTAEAPWPQPTSATVAPASSLVRHALEGRDPSLGSSARYPVR